MFAHETQTLAISDLSPFLHKIEPDIVNDLDDFDFWPYLQNGFLAMHVKSLDHDPRNEMWQFQHLTNRIENNTRMMRLSFNISPQFYNCCWTKTAHFYYKGLLFIAMNSTPSKEVRERCEDYVCLAAFKVNRGANTLDSVSKDLFRLNLHVVANTPAPLESKINSVGSLIHNRNSNDDRFFVSKQRVFSVVIVSQQKPCVWIHCFFGKSFVPIGGANTGVPGLYHFGSRRRLWFETFDGNTVGIYLHQTCTTKRDQMQVHKVARLFIRF